MHLICTALRFPFVPQLICFHLSFCRSLCLAISHSSLSSHSEIIMRSDSTLKHWATPRLESGNRKDGAEAPKEIKEEGERPPHRHTQTGSTRAELLIFFHLIFFILSVPFSPDWLVVKLMLVYRAGKGLKDETSFIACTCQYGENTHSDVTFRANADIYDMREKQRQPRSIHHVKSTQPGEWEISPHNE